MTSSTLPAVGVPGETGSVEPEILCGAEEAACICYLPVHETGPHLCYCDGSWEWIDGQMVVRRFPGGGEASLYGLLQTLDRILGL